MEHVKTAVQSKVSAGISTTHKLMIGIVMISAFSLGLSFAGMAINVAEESQTLQLVKPTKIPRPAPLMVDIIDDANTNNPISHSSVINPQATFYRATNDGISELGYLSLNGNYYVSADPWGMNPTPQGKLHVWLHHSNNNVTYFPPAVVSIYVGETFSGTWTSENVVDLCIPGSSVNPENVSRPTVYYFGADGTPYLDEYLTRMATKEKCPKLLSKQTLYSVEKASANTFANEHTRLDFISGVTNLGYLDLAYPFYVATTSIPQIQPQADNFILELSKEYPSNQNTTNINSAVITIEGWKNEEYGIWNLCLPESNFVTQYYDEKIRYFYDNNGTPYLDPFYRNMAIPYSCDQIMDKKLMAYYIYEDVGGLNTTSFNGIDDPIINFATSVLSWNSYSVNLGRVTQTYEHYDIDQSPQHNNLTIFFGHNSSTSMKFPTQFINFNYSESSQSSDYSNIRVCWPDSMVDSPLDEDARPTYYYYDKDGKPYRDALLLKPVDCKYIPPEEREYFFEAIP